MNQVQGSIRRHEVRIKVAAEGFAEVSEYDYEKKWLSGILPTVKLLKGRRIRGQIVDASSKPVSNAIVRLQSNSESMEIWDSSPFPVDSQGRFSIWIPAEGKAAGGVYPRGLAPRLFDVSAGEDQGKIVLHSGVALKGRVVDASGKGISETVVGIRSTDRRLLFAFMTLISTAVKTDEEGHFQLPPLQGEYELTVGDSKPDYSRQVMLTGNKAPAIEPFRVNVDQADPDKPVILRVESR